MKLLYDQQRIDQEITRVAAEITRDYAETKPLMVCVLRGAYAFATDLTRKMPMKLELDFTTVSSYKHGTKSGDLKLVQDVDTPVKGRDVIFIEDILDTGNTLSFLYALYKARGAKSVETAVLVRKKLGQIKDANPPKYACFECDQKPFLVGFGLDNKGYDRNLPEIFEMEEHEIQAAPGA